MPIYEFYCPRCHGRFRHLARRRDAPAPACPRCGAEEVEKMVSAAHLGHSERARREAFDTQARVAQDADIQRAAQVLQQGGDLTDEVVPLGMDRDAFREIVARRAAGATDAELEDVVDAMPLPEPPEGVAHDHDQAHKPGHGHSHHSRRDADDLGWAK